MTKTLWQKERCNDKNPVMKNMGKMAKMKKLLWKTERQHDKNPVIKNIEGKDSKDENAIMKEGKTAWWIVAKALDGQRYPLPLYEYLWVGGGPEEADDLW